MHAHGTGGGMSVTVSVVRVAGAARSRVDLLSRFRVGRIQDEHAPVTAPASPAVGPENAWCDRQESNLRLGLRRAQ